MFKFLRRKFASSLLTQKILWTMLFVFVYMVGQRIPMPTIALNTGVFKDKALQQLMSNLSAFSGGNFATLTVFSLGLGPWMTAQILMRTLTVFNLPFVRNLTSKGKSHFQMVITLLIALIQAIGMTIDVNYVGVSSHGIYTKLLARLVTMVVMISGAIILTWIGNENTKKGIGGAVVIILTNLVINYIKSLVTFFSQTSWTLHTLLPQLIIFILSVSILVMVAIVSYRAEYRVSIKRVTAPLRSSLASAYIPIRLNPAGAMPFMYGMTLMTLPPLIFSGLGGFFPKVKLFDYLAKHLSFQSLEGVICYIIILYILSIGFTYYNYDADDIAKNMRQNGDYIEGIRPGKTTRKYLQHYINIFSHIGAVIVCITGGLPMLANVGVKQGEVSLFFLVTNIFIIASFLLGFIEQVDSLRLWKKYDKLL